MALSYPITRQLSALLDGIGNTWCQGSWPDPLTGFFTRDYGTARGRANESEFTVVKVFLESRMPADTTDPLAGRFL